MVGGAPGQRMAPADPPLAQEQDRADRDVVALEEALEHVVEAPGGARDVDHRVALRARGPGVEGAVEVGDAGKDGAVLGVLNEEPPQHRRLVDDAGHHHRVVDVGDDDEAGRGGRDVDVRRRRQARRRDELDVEPVPDPVARHGRCPAPSRRGNSRRGRSRPRSRHRRSAPGAGRRAPGGGGCGGRGREARSRARAVSVRCQKTRPMTKMRSAEP